MKLERLKIECFELCYKSDYASLDTASARFLSEAERDDKGGKYEGYALFYAGVAKLLHGRDSTALSLLGRALDIARKTGNDSIEALAANSIGLYHDMMEDNYYAAQTSFVEARDAAIRASHKSLLAAVHGNLSQLSLMQNDTSSIRHARECYDISSEIGSVRSMAFGSYCMAAQLWWRKRHREALHYLRESESHYRQLGNFRLGTIFSLYSSIYCDMDSLYKALESVDSVLTIYNENRIDIVNALLQKAKVLRKQEKFVESDEAALASLELSRKISLHHYEIETFQLLADNRISENDLQGAIGYLKDCINATDTIQTNVEEQMRRERQWIMDITRKDKEISVRNAEIKGRNIAIALLSFLILTLVVASWIIIRGNKRRAELYRDIVRRHLEAIEEDGDKHPSPDVADVTDDDLPDESPECEEVSEDRLIGQNREGGFFDSGKSKELFVKLCAVMESEHLYADPMLNREMLAEKVGTNRTYLTKVVKENSGQNLPQFINSYRMREAMKRLSDKDCHATVKKLAEELGFSSDSTFIRTFKAAAGVSPAEFRKAAMQIREN